jgi:ABC-type transporter Mla subunit MlaD
MAKERNAFKAGLFIVISIGLIIGIVVGIKGIGVQQTQNATVRFKLTDDIGGLSRGDEVRVGGAKVGVVKDVEITQPDNADSFVDVEFDLPKRYTLHADAKITIQTTVTGVSCLNISTLGSGPALAPGQTLTGEPSALTELFAAIPTIKATLPKVNETLDEFKQAGRNGKELLAKAKDEITPAFTRYHSVAGTAEDALANIRDIFGETKGDFKTTMHNVAQTSESLPKLADKVDGILTKLATGMDSANVALEDIKKISADLKDTGQTVKSIIITNRGKIDTVIASLRTITTDLKGTIQELRQNPSKLIYPPSGDPSNLALYNAARAFADGAGQLSDASIALRDALNDPNADPERVRKLYEKLEQTSQDFAKVEKVLLERVKQ